MDPSRPRFLQVAVTVMTLAASGVVLAGAATETRPVATTATVREILPPADDGVARSVASAAAPRAQAPSADDAARRPAAAAQHDAVRDKVARAMASRGMADGPVPTGSTDAATGTEEAKPSETEATDAGSSEPAPADVREHAAQVLAGLPGGEAIEIAWNHPDIGNHLGGVRLDDPTVMMLNAHRFEASPELVASTVQHEIGHYYQGAVIEAHADAAGGWWNAYWQLDGALTPVFGGKWMERSADCVAIHLGATWTHYTSDCSGDAAHEAVEALIAGQMP